MSSTDDAGNGATSPTTGTRPINPADVTLVLEPILVDVPTACRMLGGISRRKLDGLILNGDITPKVIGTRVVFTASELRRFADTCPTWGTTTN